MAAPSSTTRAAPSGTRLYEGYKTLITFALDSNIALWEDTVKPFGFDGGEKVDITTMHNTSVKQYIPQTLIDITDGEMEVAYDPAELANIRAAINRRDTITVRFASGQRWAMYGYLQKFDPQQIQRGQMPKATVSFVATNLDSSNAEQVPVYEAGTA